MKKILLMLLCGMLMLSLFACGGSDKDDSSNNSEPQKNNQSQKPEVDPPEWEELTDEYDDWASECVNYQSSYRKDPENPVNQNMLKKWPRDIKDWNERTAEMLDELEDFPEEKSEYIAELKKISKKLTGIEAETATKEEADTLLAEYEAWADTYVAFEEAHDSKVSQEYKRGLRDYIFELAVWGNKINSIKLRLEDTEALADFTSEIARIDEKTPVID